MALLKSNGGGKDSVGHVYTLTRPSVVDAVKLKTEITAVLGDSHSPEGVQLWHIVTSELAYGAGALVQVRLTDGRPALDGAAETAVENAIKQHKI